MNGVADHIEFAVRGFPVPQGSTRAFVIKGRAHTTSDNPNLREWRELVRKVAQDHAPPALWTSPVSARLEFRLMRPASIPTHRGRGKKRHPVKYLPTKKPDLDKLVRAVFDALTGIVWKDDSQVIEVLASKAYGVPGLTVRLGALRENGT